MVLVRGPFLRLGYALVLGGSCVYAEYSRGEIHFDVTRDARRFVREIDPNGRYDATSRAHLVRARA